MCSYGLFTIRKPKMTKTDFLEIKISTAILIWNGRECFDQVIYEIINEKNPCSFEVTRVGIKANEFYNDTIIDE